MVARGLQDRFVDDTDGVAMPTAVVHAREPFQGGAYSQRDVGHSPLQGMGFVWFREPVVVHPQPALHLSTLALEHFKSREEKDRNVVQLSPKRLY